MRNLMMAEWQKIVGHRWMTGFTVWIFPVGAIGVFATFILLLFLMPDSKDRLLNSPAIWTDQFLGPWVMFGSAGGGLFVRVLPIVFCATVFGGEFSWGTWKNIVPRSERLSLVIVKYGVIIALLMIALLATSVIAGGATFILAGVSGQSIMPEPTTEAISSFLADYVLAVVVGFVVIVLIANYAAIASILTRSVVGGTMAGIGMMIFEEFLILPLTLLARVLNMPDIVQLYRFTPTYNLKNATYWVQLGEPSTNQFYIALEQPDTLLFSVVMLVAWCIGAMIVVSLLFRRQDITN